MFGLQGNDGVHPITGAFPAELPMRREPARRDPVQAWEDEGGQLGLVLSGAGRSEQESMTLRASSAPPPAELNIVEQLATHGITYSVADVFHVDGYRYSNLRDAIAQAERSRSRGARAADLDWRSW
jgi:hypothetical protein